MQSGTTGRATTEESDISYLAILDDDSLLNLLSFLSLDELFLFSLTARRYYNLVSEIIYKKYFGFYEYFPDARKGEQTSYHEKMTKILSNLSDEAKRFFILVTKENLPQIKQALHVNKNLAKQMDVLLYVAFSGNLALLELLIDSFKEHGSKREIEDLYCSLWRVAIYKQHRHILEYLKPHVADHHTASILADACQRGHRKTIEFLIDEMKADINHPNLNVCSVLCSAIRGRQYDIAAYLISRGANVNFQGVVDTPLTRAVQTGEARYVSLLLENGASPNSETSLSAPINLAIKKCRLAEQQSDLETIDAFQDILSLFNSKKSNDALLKDLALAQSELLTDHEEIKEVEDALEHLMDFIKQQIVIPTRVLLLRYANEYPDNFTIMNNDNLLRNSKSTQNTCFPSFSESFLLLFSRMRVAEEHKPLSLKAILQQYMKEEIADETYKLSGLGNK